MSAGGPTVTDATSIPEGCAPAIALVDPKYPHNVGMVVRLASAYGIRQVWFTGERVSLDPNKGDRLPREERMKGYRAVQLVKSDRFLERLPPGTVPVAVEVRANAETLYGFEHPATALYVFGPEDGSIPKAALARCHRFVVIPTRHCLNLATAVATVLWDREFKRWMGGEIAEPVTPGGYEERGFPEPPPDLVYAGEGL
jgi:tRNA(Leu) C34 or U34 (ribose-2'-O)-methylase TrmL